MAQIEHVGCMYVVASTDIKLGVATPLEDDKEEEERMIKEAKRSAIELVMLGLSLLKTGAMCTSPKGLSLRFQAGIHTGACLNPKP